MQSKRAADRSRKRASPIAAPRGTNWRALVSGRRVSRILLLVQLGLVAKYFFFTDSEYGLGFSPLDRDDDWDQQREEVRETFITSWDAYSKYAWGKSPVDIAIDDGLGLH